MSRTQSIEVMARREIEELHQFFVAWFTDSGDQPGNFTACEGAFAPGFCMITPSGERHGRKAVLDRLWQARGSVRGAFTIAILDLRTVWLRDDAILVEYAEHQLRDGLTTRRRSVALLTPDHAAPRGMVWRFLQETWVKPDGPA